MIVTAVWTAPAAPTGATHVSTAPYVNTYHPWLTGAVSAYDFGLVDAKGRKLGAVATIIAPSPGYPVWGVDVTVTRDGKKFGASHWPTDAATDDGAFAMASKKLTAARARYAAALAAGKKV